MSDNPTLYDLYEKMNDNHLEVMTAVTELKTNMTSLIGNGQPGRITLIEKSVEKLKQFHWKTLGYCSAASILLSLVGIAISYWRH